jgi:hypothetical protein
MSLQVNAYNGGKQATFVQNLDIKSLENKANYEYLKTEYDMKNEYSTGLTKCAAKNKYYMPSISGSDSDGCYDVLGYLNNKGLSGTQVSYVGTVPVPAGTYAGTGQYLADNICAQNYAGSRSIRADDIRYLEKTNSIPTLANAALLINPIQSIISSTNKTYGYGIFGVVLSTDAQSTCGQYKTQFNSSHRSIRIDTSGGGVTIKDESCDINAVNSNLICVND